MGRLWLRKASQRVTKRDFQCFVGAETVRPSGDHSNLVIATLHGAGRDLASGAAPVQDQFLMRPQHASDFQPRLQTAAHRSPGPVVEKGSRPSHRAVFPEVRKGFLQLPGPGRLQPAGQPRQYGFHMLLHTKRNPFPTSGPRAFKPPPRSAWRNQVAIPHNGTNCQRRSGSRS
jgi:hypothetical protein